MGLAAVKKGLLADSSSGQPGRRDGSVSPLYYDSEDTNSVGTRTPGTSTPIRFCNSVSELGAGRLSNGNMNAVSQLLKEFEQRKLTFEDEAKAVIEVNPGHSPSANPDEELRSLKHRFDTWKKEYKVRLRETKARLPKHGLTDAEKIRRKWWKGKSKKF